MQVRHVDEQIDAYVLGALEPHEIAEVEAHLAECETCRALLAASRRVADLLYYAVGTFALPPERVRQGILARIAQEQRPGAMPTPPVSAAPASFMERLRAALRPRSAAAPAHTADALQVALELLTSPRVTVRGLSGTDEAPRAQARLLVAPERGTAVLYADGLAALPPDRAYQLWLLRSGQPHDAGVFTVDAAGRGWFIVRARQRLEQYEVAAITQEPAGGSPGPTTPILVMGQLR
jgi:anti-sigma-K factor RskA